MVLIIGAAICAGSVNNGMFLVGRFINGLGIGALVSTIPMYQAEVSTPESRGFMVSMHVRFPIVQTHKTFIKITNATAGCYVCYGLYIVGMARLRHVFHYRRRLNFVIPMALPNCVSEPPDNHPSLWLKVATVQPTLAYDAKPQRRGP